jgi:anaerobic ribonucleoside-triphosphate reductase activating protein
MPDNTDFLTIADTHAACRVLGPGTRFAVWVQGCPLSCQGCISPQWIPFTGGTRVAVVDLAAQIAAADVDGLTISGGEPFAQPAGLVRLIELIRAHRDLSVMCFTGYTLEHLRRRGDTAVTALLSQIDLLVDGAYIQAKHADLRWRGSANQRIHQLTDRYTDELRREDASDGLQFEVLADGSVHWLGVPPVPGFRGALEDAMQLIQPISER